MEEFLCYLDKWEESVKGRPGFSKREKEKMLISEPTLLGLCLTGDVLLLLIHIVHIHRLTTC